jgi:hypothetical protein
VWQFLIFIIFILLLRKASRTLEEQRKEQQKEPTEEEIKNLFQTLGFPPPQEIPPEPKPERAEEPVIVKKEIKKPEVKIAELKPAKIKPPPKQVEEAKEELLTFSQDKLEEGIILSEILGPPKAYQIRRSGEIGRHA